MYTCIFAHAEAHNYTCAIALYTFISEIKRKNTPLLHVLLYVQAVHMEQDI